METVNRIIMFVTLLLAQVLILNHIHLFQIATPLLYVYFVVTFSMDTPKWVVLTSSFGLGLLIDRYGSRLYDAHCHAPTISVAVPGTS